MPGNNITIRLATEEDQHAIMRLVHETRLDSNGLDWRRFMVADEGGRIVGCAQLKIHRHGTRELHLLAFEPGRRGAGIGSRLLEALLDQETGGHVRGPGLLWARRGAPYHRSLAGAGRRSPARAPEQDDTGHGMTAHADETTDAGAAEPDGILGELSSAMQAAAGSQYQRIAEELERQRAAQFEAIKARAGSESDELKKTSQHDIAEISAWAKTATELVAAERVQRTDARRERLAAELVRQSVIAGREVVAVEAAVEVHLAELDAFFSQLEREGDPAGIARLASSLPSRPSLTEAADAARRQAAVECALVEEPAAGATRSDDTADDGAEVGISRLMAVMAPAASSGSGAEVARPWEPAPRAIAVPAGVSTATAGANESEDAEALAIAGARPLLRAIPSTRPMDRLRSGNRKPDDNPDWGR